METEVAGTSAVDDATRKDTMDKAMSIMAQGKRNVVCGEIPTAVNQFQEACKILAKTFGETSKECAEAYFCYGQALLDLARMETGVLGNALEGVPEEEEEEKKDVKESEQFENPDKIQGEEREQLRKDVYDAMAEPEKAKDENKTSEKGSDVNGEQKKDNEKDTGSESNEKMECDSTEPSSEKKSENDVNKSDSTSVEKKDNAEDTDGKPKSESDDKTGEKVEEEKKSEEKSDEKVDKDTNQNNAAESSEKMEAEESAGKKAEEVADSKKSDEKKDGPSKETEKSENMEMEESKEDKDNSKDEKKADGKTDADSEGKTEMKDQTSEENSAAKKETEKTSDKEVKLGDDKSDSKKDENNEETMDTEDKPSKNDESKDEQKAKTVDPIKGEETPDAEKTGEKDEKEENGEEEEGEGTEEDGEDDEEVLDGEDTADEEKKEGEEDPDDIPNLQLAWEMLELAKVIYLKDEDKVAQLKAAQSYLKLGEVGLETEQYEQAIGDLNECLKIQKKNLEADDRLLAETYYQLGLAYSLDKQYEPAIKSYKGAIEVIESRIVNLKKIMEKKPTENDKDSNESASSPEQELKELNELLPDIKAKIEDTEEEQKNLDQLKSMAKEIAGNAFEQLGNKPGESSTGFTSSTEPAKGTAPASDITHLVRKKRKPEDDIPDEGGDCKKSKQEIEQNGHVNGTNGTNGTAEEPEEKPMEITEKKVEDVTAPVEATS